MRGILTRENLQTELEALIAADELQIGKTFRLMKQGISNPKDLVDRGAAGNTGVASNNKSMLKSILDNQVPKSSLIARYTYRVVNRLRSQVETVSPELDEYLTDLSKRLDDKARSAEAAAHDVEVILEGSEKLAKRAKDISNAVYVYSFPTYLHYGSIEDPEYKWVKIGSTKNSAWQRIVDQSRQTSMPEDPVLIRIYHSETMSIEQIEKNFHETLEKVGHERSSASRTRAGKEWFATTEEALDQIAKLMNLKVESDFEF